MEQYGRQPTGISPVSPAMFLPQGVEKHLSKWYNIMMETVKNGASGFASLMGSASKVVLLMFAAAMTVGIFTGHIDGGLFENAAMLVLGAYFGKTAVSGPVESQ